MRSHLSPLEGQVAGELNEDVGSTYAWNIGLISFIWGLWDYWFRKCHPGTVVRMLEELPENWGYALGRVMG